jgi:ubiquinone/menaquinone biosynthesis C-methylase UbiE
MPADVFEEDFFASLYDCLNPWSVSDDFYVKQAVRLGGPVLDLGCGTGMLACSLAAKNLEVTGVDPAEAMLRIARSRVDGDKVTWIQSDGQSLRLPQRFNFIYMTGHAFQQLLNDDDAVAVLRTAAHHLKAEGGSPSKRGTLLPRHGCGGHRSTRNARSSRPSMAGCHCSMRPSSMTPRPILPTAS